MEASPLNWKCVPPSPVLNSRAGCSRAGGCGPPSRLNRRPGSPRGARLQVRPFRAVVPLPAVRGACRGAARACKCFRSAPLCRSRRSRCVPRRGGACECLRRFGLRRRRARPPPRFGRAAQSAANARGGGRVLRSCWPVPRVVSAPLRRGGVREKLRPAFRAPLRCRLPPARAVRRAPPRPVDNPKKVNRAKT